MFASKLPLSIVQQASNNHLKLKMSDHINQSGNLSPIKSEVRSWTTTRRKYQNLGENTNQTRGFGCASAWQSMTIFWPETHSRSLGAFTHFGGTFGSLLMFRVVIIIVVVVIIVIVIVLAVTRERERDLEWAILQRKLERKRDWLVVLWEIVVVVAFGGGKSAVSCWEAPV